MTLTEVERPPYEPPALEVLGELTSLVEAGAPGGSFPLHDAVAHRSEPAE